VVSVRPRKGARRRCGICQRKCPGYDHGEGRRRWRALDLGTVQTWLEADAPRVRCAEHGVVVASVPWARHDAGHTRRFDDTVDWLTPQSGGIQRLLLGAVVIEPERAWSERSPRYPSDGAPDERSAQLCCAPVLRGGRPGPHRPSQAPPVTVTSPARQEPPPARARSLPPRARPAEGHRPGTGG
jgi:hypothetical protein